MKKSMKRSNTAKKLGAGIQREPEDSAVTPLQPTLTWDALVQGMTTENVQREQYRRRSSACCGCALRTFNAADRAINAAFSAMCVYSHLPAHLLLENQLLG